MMGVPRFLVVGVVLLSDFLLADDSFGDEYGGMGDPYGGGGYGGGGYGGEDEYGYGGGGGGGDATPGFEVLEDVEAVQAFIDADPLEPAVIGFFDADRDGSSLEAFSEASGRHRYDLRFAYSTEADVASHYKFTKGPAVVVYTPERFFAEKYDKKRRARYPAKTVETDSLLKFAFKKSLPLVGQKTWKSGERYDKAGLPILTLFSKIDLEKNPKGFDYFANRLRKVAEDYRGKLVFNVGDKEDFSYVLPDYDLVLEGKNDVGVGVKDGSAYYAMAETFNVENLKRFVESFVRGELTPKIKEEAAYEAGGGGGGGGDEDYGEVDYAGTEVVQLTDANFEAEVEGKDAFLEFYAPWCGHCKTLKPAYKELASRLSGVDTVVVGAMDATANEPPAAYDVQGYPTILFKPQGAAPVSYDGNRDADSMLAFIKKNAKSPIADEL